MEEGIHDILSVPLEGKVAQRSSEEEESSILDKNDSVELPQFTLSKGSNPERQYIGKTCHIPIKGFYFVQVVVQRTRVSSRRKAVTGGECTGTWINEETLWGR